jgi:hypothetical protein
VKFWKGAGRAMSNKKQLSLYVDRETVRQVKILLLQRGKSNFSPSLSQLVENLLNLTIEKVLEGDDKWVRSVMTKISKEKGSE